MDFEIVNAVPLPTGMLDKNGQLYLRSARTYDAIPRDSLRLWCHQFARYGLPTIELVDFLRQFIAGRHAIEIGAGSGDLAYHLGIPATDSKLQNSPKVSHLYDMATQPRIRYPGFVRELEALKAVRHYNPEVVIASWVTEWIDPRLPPPPWGGCMYGVKEDKLLSMGVTYVFIGNERIHGNKEILHLPHKTLRPDFIRSRAAFPQDDLIYIWGD